MYTVLHSMLLLPKNDSQMRISPRNRSQIAKSLTRVLGTIAEPIYRRKLKNRSHFHVPLIIQTFRRGVDCTEGLIRNDKLGCRQFIGYPNFKGHHR
jgi:hypothetical protein